MQQSNDFLPKSNFFNTLILCFFFFFFPIHATKMSSFSFHHLCSIYSIWIDFFFIEGQHNTYIYFCILMSILFVHFYSSIQLFFLCIDVNVWMEKNTEKNAGKYPCMCSYHLKKKIFCCCRRLLSMYMWSSYLYKSKRKTINGWYQILLFILLFSFAIKNTLLLNKWIDLDNHIWWIKEKHFLIESLYKAKWLFSKC